jgi:outer membrane protein OmpA-like peptidoglycan-associated protein
VLPQLRFAGGSDTLESSALAHVRRLAKAMTANAGAYLIEAHVDASGDAAKDQALSDRRAATVKERLVLEGVPAGRLFAVGYGATRPIDRAANGAKSSARIEVARMQ